MTSLAIPWLPLATIIAVLRRSWLVASGEAVLSRPWWHCWRVPAASIPRWAFAASRRPRCVPSCAPRRRPSTGRTPCRDPVTAERRCHGPSGLGRSDPLLDRWYDATTYVRRSMIALASAAVICAVHEETCGGGRLHGHGNS